MLAKEGLAREGPGAQRFEGRVKDLAGGGEIVEVMGKRAGLLWCEGGVRQEGLIGGVGIAPGERVGRVGRCERLGEGKLAGGVETEELVLGGQDEVVL